MRKSRSAQGHIQRKGHPLLSASLSAFALFFVACAIPSGHAVTSPSGASSSQALGDACLVGSWMLLIEASGPTVAASSGLGGTTVTISAAGAETFDYASSRPLLVTVDPNSPPLVETLRGTALYQDRSSGGLLTRVGISSQVTVTATLAGVPQSPGTFDGAGSRTGTYSCDSTQLFEHFAATDSNSSYSRIREIGAAGPPISTSSRLAYVLTSDGLVPLNLASGAEGTPIAVHPDDLAIAPDGKTAYMTTAAATTNAVVPLDLATGTPGAPISIDWRKAKTPTALDPYGQRVASTYPMTIAIAPDGKTAYVSARIVTNSLPGANAMFAFLVPVNLKTRISGTPIPIGVNTIPGAVAITPDGARAYVLSSGIHPAYAGTVIPVNLITRTAGVPIRIGSGVPSSIAITPNGRTAYMTTYNATASALVALNLATNRLGTPIRVGESSNATVAITPNGARAYVATDAFVDGVYTGVVVTIDLATGAIGTRTPLTFGLYPWDITITPDAKAAYVVTSAGGPSDGTSVVVPVDLSTNASLTPILLAQGSANSLVIVP
jgi:DNA-binding beta-propeller fold protein YncE